LVFVNELLLYVVGTGGSEVQGSTVEGLNKELKIKNPVLGIRGGVS
jgi:hypothetical protein